ncbi:MAG: 2-amino-4-hydroxy-6-hydroxymethyldihydropteridine diphosphokinase [Alphaproteobacteria bacterium]
MATVFIAIGTNLGNRQENLKTAISELKKNNVNILSESRIYETAPMYETEQERFLNMAVMGEYDQSPDDLLKLLKKLEEEIGRVPSFRNGPRLIDLDILYYDNLVMDTEHLQIPHIRINERQFVLQPLLDINQDWIDPRTGKSINDMAGAIPMDETLKPIS